MAVDAPNTPPGREALTDAIKTIIAGFDERAERLNGLYQTMTENFKKVNIELDRKNAELSESLRTQQETQTYLGSILESMDNGVIGIDTAGAITHFNRAAVRITGFRADEAAGQPYENLFGSESESSLLTVLLSGKGRLHGEKNLRRNDGGSVPVSFENAILRDLDGALLGAVEVFADVSRIKALEEEMQRTRTMAALGEMSATVAHEIRNPLGAMGVWAGLLDRDIPAGDPRKKTLSKIIEGLSRLNRIVSNLLVYTRPVKTEFRRVDLSAVMNEIIDFVEIEIERHGQQVSIVKELATPVPALVMADPEKLQQVVMNLCLNAIQAMPQGGTLTVRVRMPADERPDRASVIISDSGIGIAAENLSKIFDPFFTTKEDGTGLGLAIVKKFIESHGGTISVESTQGKGTAFTVLLPRAV